MLRRQIEALAKQVQCEAIAVAFHDYETDVAWSYQGHRWFHAASTIKAALLVALFDAVAQGRFDLESRVHVRNRFLSAFDGEPYRVAPERDANSDVQSAVGKSMKVRTLAYHMITTSSNLATNLLFDTIGAGAAQETLNRLKIEGVELRRGVEDEHAFAAGINNRVTALGLLDLFKEIHENRHIDATASRQMIDILSRQEFTSGIPAGIDEPVRKKARFAHKTGEISTVAHDAGLVFLPDREPYALVILTEWPADQKRRQDTVSEVSRMIYQYLTESEVEESNA